MLWGCGTEPLAGTAQEMQARVCNCLGHGAMLVMTAVLCLPTPCVPAGTAQDVETEVQRLSTRLAALKARDAAAASIETHSDDPGGRILAMLLEWRQQRLRAIELEMQRLAALREEMRLDAIDEL